MEPRAVTRPRIHIGDIFSAATSNGVVLETDGTDLYAAGPSRALHALLPLFRENKTRLRAALMRRCTECTTVEAVLEAVLLLGDPAAITRAAHTHEDHLRAEHCP
jgi:hypothetical protein